jgi:hypothetical protein
MSGIAAAAAIYNAKLNRDMIPHPLVRLIVKIFYISTRAPAERLRGYRLRSASGVALPSRHANRRREAVVPMYAKCINSSSMKPTGECPKMPHQQRQSNVQLAEAGLFKSGGDNERDGPCGQSFCSQAGGMLTVIVASH